MKNALFIFAILILTSCKKETQESLKTPEKSVPLAVEGNSTKLKTPEVFGKEIFESKGNCVACHQVNQTAIGPSLKDIAKIYKLQKGDIIAFLKGNAKPIVDSSQYEIMKTNIAITKEMSASELKAIEAFIYSN
jgi:cytochrome c